jgi:hypothetical protein
MSNAENGAAIRTVPPDLPIYYNVFAKFATRVLQKSAQHVTIAWGRIRSILAFNSGIRFWKA